MTISKFVSELKERGISKASHYIVEIIPPPFYSTPIDESFIPLFCEQAQMPEISLATETIKDNGISRESVYDKQYGSITMTFVCDQNMLIKSFFDRWVLGVVMSKGGVFAYPKEYTSPWIRIYQLNSNLDVVYTVNALNCYPKVVDDIRVSSASHDYNRISVLFAIESWESETKIMTSDYINSVTNNRNSGNTSDNLAKIRTGIIKAGAGMMTGVYNNGANRTSYESTKLNSLKGRAKSLVDNFTDWTL